MNGSAIAQSDHVPANVDLGDLARRCRSVGRDLLGFGDAGIVIGAGPRWVIKLGYDPADGWPAWARWCQGQASPHLPAVPLIELLEVGERLGFVAVVERLRPTAFGHRWIRPVPQRKRDPLALATLIEAEHPSLAAVLRQAAAAFPAARWDMAPDNWMERADGTLVITDPISRADAREAAAA